MRAPVLGREFYQRPTDVVARELLGKLLVRTTTEGIVAVRLAEVEAYLGAEDPACHTFGGRRTARTETMWGEAGMAYVYLIYGLHNCLNVVTVGPGVGEAVLVRGGLTAAGGGLVRSRRGSRVPESGLTDGPGKLCQALAVSREDDGSDLCGPSSGLWICDDGVRVADASVTRTPRIGVHYAGEAAAWPLRFVWTTG
jgi:DNA-3-methyladenine glycosylase